MNTEYYSVTQIAKDLNKKIIGGISVKDVQWALRQLGYTDFKNRPNMNGRMFVKEAHTFKGQKYYKWEKTIAEEIGDLLYERSFR